MIRNIRAFAFLAGLVPVVACAQTFQTLPANTVIGRLGIGSGPAQAIPFTALPWTVGSTSISGGTSGNVLYDNNGKLGEYSASAARTFLGLSGVYSVSGVANQWIASITNGVPTLSQPAFSNLSGNIAASQMNSGTAASTSTMWRGDATWVAPQTMPYTPTNASPSAQSIQAQLQKIPVSCEDYLGGCTTANIQQAMTDAVANSRCYQFNNTYTLTATVSLVATGSNPCFTGKGGLRGPASGALSAVLEIKNFTGMTVDGNITLDCNSNAYIGAGLKLWSSGPSAQFQVPAFSEWANCRQAIVIGDPSQSTVAISEINFSRGFFFNVAQGVRVWSSNAVVNFTGFTNNVDPHSSGNWALTATTSGCTTNTVTFSSVGANSFFDQYDVISGTGIVAGTYITGQVTGPAGGAGQYNLSTTGNSCGVASITGEKRGINIWTSGGTVNVVGGEVANTVVNNGYLCVVDIMASPNSYGNCNFTGPIIEAGGSLAATFNPTGIVSPTGGGIQFVGTRGFVGGLTSTNLVTTDSTFPGNVTFSGNRLFSSVGGRTGLNIVGGSTATNIYFDLVSFGANMLQGYAGVSGGTQYMTSKDYAPSGAAITANASQNPADSIISFNCAATCTYTLLNAAAYPGRTLFLNSASAQAVNSASANILNQSGAAVSSIFPATAGKWMILISDQGQGNFWRIVANN